MKNRQKLRAMEQLVRSYEESGLSARAFCAQKRVKLHILAYWRQRLRAGEDPTAAVAGFTQFSLKEESEPVRLTFDNGMTLDVSGLSVPDLALLVSMLKQHHA